METNQYSVVLFYFYRQIEDTVQHQKWQTEICNRLNLLGRIRVAEEGINGTLSGTHEDIRKYMDAIKATKMFEGIQWKLSSSDSHTFPNLKVMPRRTVVNLGVPVNAAETGYYLSPQEFHEELMKAQNDPDNYILIDCRNNYESRVGRFKNAILPNLRQFSDFPKYFDELIEKNNVSSKKLLTYCTGGVRCETATSYLRGKGMKDVFQLAGGIHMYLENFPDGGFFEGKNFVFDDRVIVGPQNAEVVGRCHGCDKPYEDYSRKRSCPFCRILLLVCEDCDSLTHIDCNACVKSLARLNVKR